MTPTATTESEKWTLRGNKSPAYGEYEPSPTRGTSASPKFGGLLAGSSRGAVTGVAGDINALGKLQPAQVRELREGFQILDRDSDGQVGREDVADMLTQLGT